MGTLFSASLFFHLLAKLLFNMIADIKMPLDLWTIIDVLCSVFNIVCFNTIGSIKPEDIRDPVTGEMSSTKETLDYYVIAVVIVSWLRFFGYFLVIRRISKLIMTLVQMLYDTLSFIFLVACYMIIATTVFTTLFSNADSDNYGYIAVAMRTLYDAFIG